MASQDSDIETSDEDLAVPIAEIEAAFKEIRVAVEACIKGLNAAAKRVKKEGREDIIVATGKSRGKRLTEVLDLAVGTAKSTGASFGAVVLGELEH
jgi:hypothetical protein